MLIVSFSEKPTDWPLARVQRNFKEEYGYVRLLKMKTSKGTSLQPIQHVYPIEISGMEDHQHGQVKCAPKQNGQNEDIKWHEIKKKHANQVQVLKRGST